jgi:hypothetical protein
MEINKEKRICPYRGEEFIPKRSNQVYANGKFRTYYNNKKSNDKRKLLASINKPLIKNFDIFNWIVGDEPYKIVHKEFLRGAGFNFSVFTHISKDEKINKLCYSVYHFYYFKVDDNNYKIVNNG